MNYDLLDDEMSSRSIFLNLSTSSKHYPEPVFEQSSILRKKSSSFTEKFLNPETCAPFQNAAFPVPLLECGNLLPL